MNPADQARRWKIIGPVSRGEGVPRIQTTFLREFLRNSSAQGRKLEKGGVLLHSDFLLYQPS